jgi:hypothetical protein
VSAHSTIQTIATHRKHVNRCTGKQGANYETKNQKKNRFETTYFATQGDTQWEHLHSDISLWDTRTKVASHENANTLPTLTPRPQHTKQQNTKNIENKITN